MKIIPYSAIMVFVGVLSLSGCAADNEIEVSPTVCTVHVREAETHNPVTNAIVMIAETGGSPELGRASSFVAHSLTDANGECEVELRIFMQHYDVVVVSPRHVTTMFVVQLLFMQKHPTPPSWVGGTQSTNHPHLQLSKYSPSYYSASQLEIKVVRQEK